MIKKFYRSQLTLLFFCAVGQLWGQNYDTYTISYQVFDGFISLTNTGIYNGIEYYEQFPMRNEKHKFFKTSSFENGSLIFDKRPFYKVDLRYDVYKDQLLARNSEVLGSPIIQLDKTKILEFNLLGHRFVNMSFELENGSSQSGFFETLVSNNSFTIYKKYGKKINKKTDDGVYYEFKNQTDYFVNTNDSFYQIKNDNAIFSAFPQYKSDLRTILDLHRAKRKKNYDNYILSIFTDLEKLVGAKK